jgi:hypothetical protein
MTKDEALKLALYGLEIGLPLIEDFGSTEEFNAQHKAIAAIYKALAQPEERNFCPRCGKRTPDLTHIHTCTPPQENT